jgi:hypothetical protein
VAGQAEPDGSFAILKGGIYRAQQTGSAVDLLPVVPFLDDKAFTDGDNHPAPFINVQKPFGTETRYGQVSRLKNRLTATHDGNSSALALNPEISVTRPYDAFPLRRRKAKRLANDPRFSAFRNTEFDTAAPPDPFVSARTP